MSDLAHLAHVVLLYNIAELLSANPTAALSYLIYQEETDAAMTLLKTEKNTLELHTPCGLYSDTPLHTAVRKKNYALATALLKAGADSSITNENKRTPLHLAISQGDVAMVQTLLKGKVSPHTLSDGATPREWAERYKQPVIADLLDLSEIKVALYDAKAYLPSQGPQCPTHTTEAPAEQRLTRTFSL